MKRFFVFSVVGAFCFFVFASLGSASESRFSDVSDFYSYGNSVQDLADKGVIQGYADGTFRPYATASRAELLTLVYRAVGLPKPVKPKMHCFPDVPASSWFAPYVCAAKDLGIVKGRNDGRFYPFDEVNLAESGKMIAGFKKMDVADPASGQAWYIPYLQALSDRSALPTSLEWVGQNISRGELSEILWRLENKDVSRAHVTLTDLQTDACQVVDDELDMRFDIQRVRDTWFSWINDVRTKSGLPAYEHDDQLDRTANDWAQTMLDRGVISHKRDPGDAYYNYSKIAQWFADRGIVAKNVNRVTFTENIGGGYLQCHESDCTDELIDAIRYTFDGYMREGPGGAHYNSVMNAYFHDIGFGLRVGTDGHVYAATHYATEIISNPLEMCPKLSN